MIAFLQLHVFLQAAKQWVDTTIIWNPGIPEDLQDTTCALTALARYKIQTQFYHQTSVETSQLFRNKLNLLHRDKKDCNILSAFGKITHQDNRKSAEGDWKTND